MHKDYPKPPVMTVGKYAGVPIDQIPNSYLRWMMNQKFPEEILRYAREKLAKSDYSNIFINISRHALDMFSKRFLFDWIQSENHKGDKADGLGTYVAKQAQDAWDNGEDVSRHRHEEDGIVKLHRGIRWVFAVSEFDPDYKDVITVFPEHGS